MRSSASRIQPSRWPSNSANEPKARPAMAFRLTYFTPDSVLPLVRARYGRQTRASTPKSRQKAAKAGCSRAVCVASSRPITRAPSLVDEQRARHAAESLERAGDALAPVVLPCAQKRPDEEPAREPEHCTDEEDAYQIARDAHQALANVDLHLLAGRGLEPYRRHLRRALAAAALFDRALYARWRRCSARAAAAPPPPRCPRPRRRRVSMPRLALPRRAAAPQDAPAPLPAHRAGSASPYFALPPTRAQCAWLPSPAARAAPSA